MRPLIVDNFAGGGGASAGIEAALGQPIDYAINHDAEAIAMHRANHPHTRHLQTSVWDVNPRKLCAGRSVSLGWFSPDCTFHSKARGGKPFRERDTARRRRGLAWLVPYWAKAVRPRVIMLENVEEFADWGPLLDDGKICPIRRGMTFLRWHRMIENLGYQVDMRVLRAADYGAPTTRKRLFVIARCDGEEIVFPEATHGPGLTPYRTAAECIDWSIPCPSIFERERPLVEATMRRIARGVMRYVVNNPQPFIVTLRGTERAHIDASAKSVDSPLRTISANGNHHALVSPALINTRNGERAGQAPRVRSIEAPYPTVTAIGSQGALVAAFLARHYGGHENDGSAMRSPMRTITTKDHHALVMAFLLKYYGTDQNPGLSRPLDTVTTKDRFGLVMVRGQPHRIVDIGMRMLTPRELYHAQSFPPGYIIDRGASDDGEVVLSKAAQVRMCGNSVPPAVAEALVRANCVEQRAEIGA
ncbi:MAG: DNA cytosine methyltransferase [Steroidobacteraceae bacterium]